jgi:hypothetical protein
MADIPTDGPVFWGVWTKALEGPELFASKDEAAKRAYEIAAKVRVGTRVHLMRLASVGWVEYPNNPSASGELAGNIHGLARD